MVNVLSILKSWFITAGTWIKYLESNSLWDDVLLLFCRQLSSLSQHAEDMFRELFVEATTIFERTCNLSNKVDSLRDSVQQFDPNQVVGKFLIFS